MMMMMMMMTLINKTKHLNYADFIIWLLYKVTNTSISLAFTVLCFPFLVCVCVYCSDALQYQL